MQKIKNVYVDVYCIKDGMVHIFFLFGGRGHAEKQFILCAHKIFAGGGEMGWECVDYHGVSKYNDGW